MIKGHRRGVWPVPPVRIILSAPVPVPFLWTWIWDLDLGLDLGLTIKILFHQILNFLKTNWFPIERYFSQPSPQFLNGTQEDTSNYQSRYNSLIFLLDPITVATILGFQISYFSFPFPKHTLHGTPKKLPWGILFIISNKQSPDKAKYHGMLNKHHEFFGSESN